MWSASRGPTHYPSWGSETAESEMPLLYRRHSLPLMGIGNVRDRQDNSPDHRLITPHGDRKRRSAWGDTHRNASHYPSWGSETTGYSMVFRDAFSLITPHGDRKPLASGDWTRIDVHLITPHGDRKRERADAQARLAGAHYPSWGSETDRREGCRGIAPGLITPHGDRKQECRRLYAGPDRTSLPLMGIGNRPRADSVPGWRPLITPHGDRKPPALAGSSAGYHSHYPSWGSETSALQG